MATPASFVAIPSPIVYPKPVSVTVPTWTSTVQLRPISFRIYERPEGAPRPRRRVRGSPRTRVACLPCSLSKSACASQRPCQRCIRLDMQDACINRIHRKMGRPASAAQSTMAAPGAPIGGGGAAAALHSIWRAIFTRLLHEAVPEISAAPRESGRCAQLPIPTVDLFRLEGESRWHLFANNDAVRLLGYSNAQLCDLITSPQSFRLLTDRDWRQMIDQTRRSNRLSPLYVTVVAADGTATNCLLVVTVADAGSSVLIMLKPY